MTKPIDHLTERRRFLRLRTPINITYAGAQNGKIHTAVTKDISADGIRFETHDKNLKELNIVEMKLDLPGAANPVHARTKIMWKKKVSLADDAAYDVGAEISEIEEDNKNTFLKFLCDLIYKLPEERNNE